MDKTVLRNFAIESRKDLMEKIDRKIKLFYIDEEFKKENRGDVIVLSNDKHSLTLTKEEDSNRDKLLKRIIELGYDHVVEEAAYTWFNRIIAIRYMEINDYLPLTSNNQSLNIRVLSSRDGSTSPEILKFSNLNRNDLDLKFNKEFYSTLNNDEAKFKYVLLLICKKLREVIPQVFDGITDYIDLLVPDNMLSETGFITKTLKSVPEDEFNKVEIIGWLYQYYNQTEKDRVISAKKTYKKYEIAYATQLFTPDWVVKYMVENSLGRFYLEHGGDYTLIDNWNYYIKSDVDKLGNVDPSKITFIDPCCGSGHILVYAFELFYSMYEYAGYNKKDIAELILKNNLYGLDVDDRAGQLATLALLLKAREYDKDLFKKDIVKNINIVALQESGSLDAYAISTLPDNYRCEAEYLKEKYKNAKETGSLLLGEGKDYSNLEKYLYSDNTLELMLIREKLIGLIRQEKMLSLKYSVVVTNPPYLNSALMSKNIKEYISKKYSDFKTDLFSCFIIRNSYFGYENSYLGYMTPNVWMFISSYEKLRKHILKNLSISSFIQLAKGSFFKEATVDICSFIIKNNNSNKNGIYYRLEEFKGDMEQQRKMFLSILNSNNKNIYVTNAEDLLQLPNSILGYWLSNKLVDLFKNDSISSVCDAKQGMTTSDNNRFLRYWYEVDRTKIGFGFRNREEASESEFKWFPYNKGGEYRKWYGNNDYVVNYYHGGEEMEAFHEELNKTSSGGRIKNKELYFKHCISWSKISSGSLAFRYKEDGFIFDVAGSSIFAANDNILKYILAIFNSKLGMYVIGQISQTLNYEAEHIKQMPLIINKDKLKIINELVDENIELCKEEWNSYETSWDFREHPFITYKGINIKESFDNWNKHTIEKKNKLKTNEVKLNQILLDIYGLTDEVSYDIDDKEIAYRNANELNDIKSFLSYFVGCLFGRYKIDGFISKNFIDDDNIIPISDNESVYYNDDIVGKLKEFIISIFGKENLNININYIAEVLGKKGTETSEDTIRRYFVNDFFNDHVKTYQKRPIYWLFDSGKKNGFKCLIYLHRYDEQLVSKIRTKYLHNTLSIYQRTVEEIDYELNNEELSTTDKRELQNKKSDLNGKITECNEYEEMVGNVANKMIKLDLDDGVAINYAKFVDDNGKSILAKIK